MATNKKSYADLSFDFTANPQTGESYAVALDNKENPNNLPEK